MFGRSSRSTKLMMADRISVGSPVRATMVNLAEIFNLGGNDVRRWGEAGGNVEETGGGCVIVE